MEAAPNHRHCTSVRTEPCALDWLAKPRADGEIRPASSRPFEQE